MKLSTEQHPYYPADWLDVQSASQMLAKAGLPSRLNVTRCKKEHITYSSTGHIRKLSLENYIALKKSEYDPEVYRQFLENVSDNDQYKSWLDQQGTPDVIDY